MRVQLDADVPVIFGVLTCLTDDQALDRAGLGRGVNGKGHSGSCNGPGPSKQIDRVTAEQIMGRTGVLRRSSWRAKRKTGQRSTRCGAVVRKEIVRAGLRLRVGVRRFSPPADYKPELVISITSNYTATTPLRIYWSCFSYEKSRSPSSLVTIRTLRFSSRLLLPARRIAVVVMLRGIRRQRQMADRTTSQRPRPTCS